MKRGTNPLSPPLSLSHNRVNKKRQPDESSLDLESSGSSLRENLTEAFPLDDADDLCGSATKDLEKWTFGQDDDEIGDLNFALTSPNTTALLLGLLPSPDLTSALIGGGYQGMPKTASSGSLPLLSLPAHLSVPANPRFGGTPRSGRTSRQPSDIADIGADGATGFLNDGYFSDKSNLVTVDSPDAITYLEDAQQSKPSWQSSGQLKEDGVGAGSIGLGTTQQQAAVAALEDLSDSSVSPQPRISIPYSDDKSESIEGWTPEMDEGLRDAVLRFGDGRWDVVSEVMQPHVASPKQCQKRWETISVRAVKGPWSAEEDEVLTQLVKVYGTGRWKLVSSKFPGRTGKQCRERWLNHLQSTVSDWETTDDQMLVTARNQLGDNWTEIASLFPGCGEKELKARYDALQIGVNNAMLSMNTTVPDFSLSGNIPHWLLLSGGIPGLVGMQQGGIGGIGQQPALNANIAAMSNQNSPNLTNLKGVPAPVSSAFPSPSSANAPALKAGRAGKQTPSANEAPPPPMVSRVVNPPPRVIPDTGARDPTKTHGSKGTAASGPNSPQKMMNRYNNYQPPAFEPQMSGTSKKKHEVLNTFYKQLSKVKEVPKLPFANKQEKSHFLQQKERMQAMKVTSLPAKKADEILGIAMKKTQEWMTEESFRSSLFQTIAFNQNDVETMKRNYFLNTQKKAQQQQQDGAIHKSESKMASLKFSPGVSGGNRKSLPPRRGRPSHKKTADTQKLFKPSGTLYPDDTKNVINKNNSSASLHPDDVQNLKKKLSQQLLNTSKEKLQGNTGPDSGLFDGVLDQIQDDIKQKEIEAILGHTQGWISKDVMPPKLIIDKSSDDEGGHDRRVRKVSEDEKELHGQDHDSYNTDEEVVFNEDDGFAPGHTALSPFKLNRDTSHQRMDSMRLSLTDLSLEDEEWRDVLNPNQTLSVSLDSNLDWTPLGSVGGPMSLPLDVGLGSDGRLGSLRGVSGSLSSFVGAQSFGDISSSEKQDAVLTTAEKLKKIATDFKEGIITSAERKELKEKILKGEA